MVAYDLFVSCFYRFSYLSCNNMNYEQELHKIDAASRSLYNKLQDPNIPKPFKHPEQFNAEYESNKIKRNQQPNSIFYRTASGGYGDFQPQMVEMPLRFRSKNETFLKSVNYQNTITDRLHSEPVKYRYMDPWATIRRK